MRSSLKHVTKFKHILNEHPQTFSSKNVSSKLLRIEKNSCKGTYLNIKTENM